MKFKNRTSITLTEYVANRVTDAIESGRLPPGSRLPSIRSQAQESGVSTFTVVEAYDRLVAQGRIASQRGSGFFSRHAPRYLTGRKPHWPICQSMSTGCCATSTISRRPTSRRVRMAPANGTMWMLSIAHYARLRVAPASAPSMAIHKAICLAPISGPPSRRTRHLASPIRHHPYPGGQ